MNEGYIKFDYKFIDSLSPTYEIIEDVNGLRTALWDRGLLGILPDGISFGNISKRVSESTFVISGSNTGKYRILSPDHYVYVNESDISSNLVVCSGKIPPSSESLTHLAVYCALPSVRFVVHFHNSKLWSKFLNIFPSTSPKAKYGTVELANELRSLCKTLNPQIDNIVILGGHKEGIVAFAENIGSLRKQIFSLLDCPKQI